MQKQANIQNQIPENSLLVGYVAKGLNINEYHDGMICVPFEGGYHLYKELPKKK